MSNLSGIFHSAAEVPDFAKIPRIEGRILIGGKIRSSGFKSRPVISPCSLVGPDGKLSNPEIGTTPDLDEKQFMEAVDAAALAWNKGRGEWPTARMEVRIQAIQSLKQQILAQRDIICRLLMWEIAKTWTDAQAEFDRTIQYMDDTLEAVKALDRDCSRIQFSGGIMAQIRRAPLGVALCMGPFNYPFNETFATLIPALIMGNTAVVKSPRFGVLLWDALLEAFKNTLPPGVVNIVNGSGRTIISPSIQAGKIDVLAFIGSSPVANKIKLAHPEPHHFRGVLGLDAKNPALILPDADLDIAASECVRGSLSFNGQRCTALKIIFVQKSVARPFIQKMVEAVEKLKVGMPWQPGVSITPIPDPMKLGQLKSYVDEAIQMGAKLSNPKSGGRVEGSLYWPSLVEGVPLNSKLATEEQFGPVVPIVEYDSTDEFEDYVVHSPYGMQMSLFGRDPEKLGGLIDHMANQVCRINLNAQCQRGPDVFPFTGRKRSAEGTLSVTDALRSFSIRSMVAAKQDPSGKQLVQDILHGDHSHFLSTHITL
ncbi:MAG: aldehyde dehydrogenase family protein [Bdellovibrionales bacterium]|nr:aldehyde dehydrogenase family protein [Bdellovibrionales bacterium]